MPKNSMSLDVESSILENSLRIVEDTPMEKELRNIFGNADNVPTKTVLPSPGFCVKTFTKPDRKKIFVNICTTDAIPCARDISSDELRAILNSDDPSNYRIPMSLGAGRHVNDKSGVPVTVYDIAIHPNFYHKIQNNSLFHSFFLTVAFEGIQDKYQFELDDMQDCIILKNRKCFGELQSHRIELRDIQPCQDQGKAPLIQEVVTNGLDSEDNEIVYRLTKYPVAGDIEYLKLECRICPMVDLNDLSVQVNDQRVVMECLSLKQSVDIMLPYSVCDEKVDAVLDRNINILSVMMPVLKC